ncbi:MAG: isochorismate synthase MenF [Actinomycetes bacterium]
MTSMEDPGPEVPPGSERLDPPAPPQAVGPAPAPREGRAPRLWSRVVRLEDGLDPLSLAGEDGFVWSSPAGTLVGTGIVAKVPVGTGPGRIERAAEAVAALLAAVDIEDPDGTGLGPAAVGALPFHPATPGELVVPALLLRADPTGRTWAVLTEPGPFDPPAAADLVAGLRASAAGDHRWPPARRLDGPWPIAGSVPGGGGSGSAAPGDGLWTAPDPERPGGLPSRSGAPPAGGGAGARPPGGPGALSVPGGRGASPDGSGAGPDGSGRSPEPSGLEAWRSGVRAALEAIGTGRLDKVVLAREAAVEADWPFPRVEVLRRLRRRGGGSTFLYASGGFVGASPELLVRRRGRVAVSRPMAGTVPTGDSAADEAGGLARLTRSPKEGVEHRLVVDAVAEGLAKVADRVRVGRPEVVRLATVAHLATEITADLTGPLPTALELAGLLHPTPAVGGSPRDAALAAIAALEPFDRGCYAGPIGWVDHTGDGEWAVALRGATLDGRRAHLLAGAGIVPGSDPDAEWVETEHKLRAMLEVLLTP